MINFNILLVVVVGVFSSLANGQTPTETPTVAPTPTPTDTPSPTAAPIEITVNNTLITDAFNNMTLFGRAVLVNSLAGRYVSLTSAYNHRGAIVLNLPPVFYPSITFRLMTGGGPAPGGEGIAFSFGQMNFSTSFNETLWGPTRPAWGYGNGVVIQFKTSADTANNVSKGINVLVNGASGPVATAAPDAPLRSTAWFNIAITFRPPSTIDPNSNTSSALLSVQVEDVYYITNLTINNWAPDANWTYAFSASTSPAAGVNGQYWDNQRLSNLKVMLDVSINVSLVLEYVSLNASVNLDIYSAAALEAAILTARGSPVIRAMRSSLKARRLLQTSTGTGTVQVVLEFAPAPDGRNAFEVAYAVIRSINSGEFGNFSNTAFRKRLPATIPSVPRFLRYKTAAALQDFITAVAQNADAETTGQDLPWTPSPITFQQFVEWIINLARWLGLNFF